MLLTAHAKINWAISVNARRDDGYHMLDMLLHSVRFGDTLRIMPAAELTLTLHGKRTVPLDASNLAMRAALMLQSACGVTQGASIHLTKRIPVGAGMGGGSADAAAVLLGLNRLWDLRLSGEELTPLAAKVGADVPFCLVGGLCRVQGIGDRLSPIACKTQHPLLIVQPCAGLSTQTVFTAYDKLSVPPKQPCIEGAAQALKHGDANALATSIGNALHAAALPLRPEIAACAQTLEHYGALRAQMTGTGSAVFGLFDSNEAMDAAYAEVSRIWPKTIRTQTAPCGISILEDIK